MAYRDKRGQNRKKKREGRVSDVYRTRGPRPTGPVKVNEPAPVGTRQPGHPIVQPEMGKVPSLGGGGSMRQPDSKPPKTSTSPPENKGQNWRDRQGDIQLFGPNALGSAQTTYSARTGGGPIQTQVLGIPDMIRGAAGMLSDFQKARKESADQINSELGESLRKSMVAAPAPSPAPAPEKDIDDFMESEFAEMGGTPARPVSGGSVPFAKSVAQSALSAMTPRTPDQLVDSFNRSPMGQATAGMIPDALKQRAASIPQTPGQLRSQTDAIYKSPANVAERERLRGRQQAVERKFDGIQEGYQKMADKQLYDTSDPKNMAMAVAPRENVGINEGMVAASGQRARDRFARATQPGGLPDVPFRSRTPETGRKTLPDVRAEFAPPKAKPLSSFPDKQGNTQEFRGLANSLQQAQEIQGRPRSNQEPQSGQGSDDGRIRMRSTVNRQTLPDGRQVTFGGGLNVENGNIITTDAAGNKRAVILPSSGNSIGLRTAEVDSQGNFVPGTFKTQSDEARRKERQDLAILKGNQPGATAEEKLAGQQAKEAQDKYAAYKARRDKREADALDIRSAAQSLRGYGPVGMQNVGYSSMGQNVNPEFAMKYGQTGPSLAQAAGMVRRQREAQERMDEAMKRQRDREDSQARQNMLMEAYKANPNDPRLADAYSKELGLRDRTPQEQSRYDRDQFNLKIGQMAENNELTMDPRQIPGTGVGDLDPKTRSKLAAGIDDALKSDLLSDEERDQLFKNVDLDVMAELIDGTAWDQEYWDGDRSEKLYKDFEAYLKRTGKLDTNKPTEALGSPSNPEPYPGTDGFFVQ